MVKRRPRRTVEAVTDRLVADFTVRPKIIVTDPVMLEPEFLKPLVEEYLAALKVWQNWNRYQYTATGRRKKGKALEEALSYPAPPFPQPPLFGYVLPPEWYESMHATPERERLWCLAVGMPVHSRSEDEERRGD
jgi:hypothetical protein